MSILSLVDDSHEVSLKHNKINFRMPSGTSLLSAFNVSLQSRTPFEYGITPMAKYIVKTELTESLTATECTNEEQRPG